MDIAFEKMRSTNLEYASFDGCSPSEATKARLSNPCCAISVINKTDLVCDAVILSRRIVLGYL